MTHKIVIAALLAIIELAAIALTWRQTPVPVPVRNAPANVSTELLIPQKARVLETPHYRVHYTGTLQQAQLIGSAVEKLYTAYISVFPPQGVTASGKLTLVLFKDQAEFKQNNRSSPWAEAYYLAPACYAYFSPGPNRNHWMLHEATHQLAREVRVSSQSMDRGRAGQLFFDQHSVTRDCSSASSTRSVSDLVALALPPHRQRGPRRGARNSSFPSKCC